MVWGNGRIAAAALKTPTRIGYNAQGGNLTFNKSIAFQFACTVLYHSGTDFLSGLVPMRSLTETKNQSPDTGARANNTLHK